jgi:hypothetical protein
MAKVICKGTVLKQDISAVLTAVAQVIEISHSGAEVETTEVTTLDTSGAGKEYLATGFTEGGSVDFSIFYDPALAGHQALTDDVTTPAERDYEITFADTGTTASAFTAAGIGFGFTVAQNDGLKADISLKLDQLMTYST